MSFGVNNENNNDASFQLCGAQFGHLLPLNLQTYALVKKTATTYYQFSVPMKMKQWLDIQDLGGAV